ncbi:ABC transporter ATP-binding protein [Clostridium chrysemydis]|uniref:iron ABC transporter ATP-binding protein n=1 Tax=Clostridium chrysemydis TaxID=2665504 RepID=UPI0018840C59|nr:ATP-binding cassette domain-containing protein [Clostridium chrysemydis]
MIEVRNITKKYGDKKVLDDVSLKIEKGKITSFIGPNGAGKSTLLSIIARIDKEFLGEVIIDDKDIKNYDENELSKKLSILRQSNNINVRITVEELVSFGRFPYCAGRLKKEDYNLVNKAINYMELNEIKDKYLDELSGGQRQRAFIAMVIAQDTQYILLDEPLNNLDMKHSVKMMRVLKNLAKDLNKTVIIVMHDINFASCYSDNIVVLKDGKLKESNISQKIINKDFLEEVYEIEFDIHKINENSICVYF